MITKFSGYGIEECPVVVSLICRIAGISYKKTVRAVNYPEPHKLQAVIEHHSD
jgi:hypothetical protein